MNTNEQEVYKHLHKHMPNVNEAIKRHKKGVSSFAMQDSTQLLHSLGMEQGAHFVDLGCGAGDYSVCAAQIVGPVGKVYAIDQWENIQEVLSQKAKRHNLSNITAVTCDITSALPIETGSIDVCFIATVLHCLNMSEIKDSMFTEIKRILKPTGKFVSVDCKKEKTSQGPPEHIRLSPDQLKEIVEPFGFKNTKYTDLGFNYSLEFAPLP